MARLSPVGRIVVLNGPSSAGKTTLAHAVRDARPATTVAVSIDRLFSFAAPAHPNNWRLYAALTRATFAAATAFSDEGFDVLVDVVFERADCADMARAAFVNRAHHFVAVTCSLDLLEERELARGNRRIGQAREQHQRVLEYGNYEMNLDTGATTITENVSRILELLPK